MYRAPTFKRTAQFRETIAAPATVPPIVHEVLRSPGLPLDLATHAYLETAFWAWLQPGAGAHWRENISCGAGGERHPATPDPSDLYLMDVSRKLHGQQ